MSQLVSQRNELIHSIDADYTESLVLTGSSDGVLRLFKVESDTLVPLSEFRGHNSSVTRAVFLNKGEMLCSSSCTGELVIWKMEEKSYVKKLEKKVFNGSINSIGHRWCGDSFKVYCACSDGNLRIVEFDSKLETKVQSVFCHRYGVSSISVSEKYVLTGGMDGSAALFNTSDLRPIERFSNHKKYIRDVGLCNTGEFDLIAFATCSDDGSVNIYTKAESGPFKIQSILINEPVYSISWSKSGYSLSVGYGQSNIKHFAPDVSGEFREIVMEDAPESAPSQP